MFILFNKSKKFAIVLIICCLLAGTAAEDNCPRIKLKKHWGGKPATDLTYQVRPIRYVVIHHTVSQECNTYVKCAEIVRNIQGYQMRELKYDDIAFNFLIGNDGNIYEGTGWGVRGSHTYGYNMNGTGIAFIGNFIEKLPSRAALIAAKKLLACGVQLEELHPNYHLLGGSQAIATESPGLTLYNEIQNWQHWTPNP